MFGRGFFVDTPFCDILAYRPAIGRLARGSSRTPFGARDHRVFPPSLIYCVPVSMKLYSLLLMAPLIACAADDPYAAQLFVKNCASCHASSAQAGARIPQMDVLKTLSPLTILRTLDSGVMKPHAARLSGNERQALANYLGAPVINERRREEIANPCPAGMPAW